MFREFEIGCNIEAVNIVGVAGDEGGFGIAGHSRREWGIIVVVGAGKVRLKGYMRG